MLVDNLKRRSLRKRDLPQVLDVISACLRKDGGLPLMLEPAFLRERCGSLSGPCSLGVAAPAGELVAWGAAHSVGGLVRVFGQVHPEWRGRGIGRLLLAQSLARGARIGGPAEEIEICTETWTGAGHRLYRRAGFEERFSEIIMRRDLATEPFRLDPPRDVALAAWSPRLAAEFFRCHEASFRERPGFPGWNIATWTESVIENPDFRPDLSLLVRVGNAPVAFAVTCGEWILQIGVRPEFRRRGIAAFLLSRIACRLRDDGASATHLTVAENNPGAVCAYRAAGYVRMGRRARYRRQNEGQPPAPG